MGFMQQIEKVTEAKWYKLMMPKLYGWGAAVVILGALFKIEHLPGASYMLMAGLGLEAIIFFFSAFEKPHVEPEELWACTSCNACVEACPINIDPLSIIIDLRRYLVMENDG